MKRLTCSTNILALVMLVLVSASGARAVDGSDLLIEATTNVSLQLLSPVSTATSRKGDKFTCKILTPAEFAGAIVEGQVRSVKRSVRPTRNRRSIWRSTASR